MKINLWSWSSQILCVESLEYWVQNILLLFAVKNCFRKFFVSFCIHVSSTSPLKDIINFGKKTNTMSFNMQNMHFV